MSQVTIHRVDQPDQRTLPILAEIAKRFEEIRSRAFELFEKRRSEAGHALEDWLRAEHEVLGSPVAELSEHKDGYELQVRLPGLQAKHVRVTATPAEIIVQASSDPEKSPGKAAVLWSEFGPPEISRRFELPGPIDTAKVSAKLEKGVLVILIPKGQPAKPEEVTVMAA